MEFLNTWTYYLTSTGRIVRVEEVGEQWDNPLEDYGIVGAVDDNFKRNATTNKPLESAVYQYGDEGRVFGIGTKDYHKFYRDDKAPALFVATSEPLDSDTIDSLIADFEAWYGGDIYSIKTYRNDLGDFEDYYLHFGSDWDRVLREQHTIKADISPIVDLYYEARTEEARAKILDILTATETEAGRERALKILQRMEVDEREEVLRDLGIEL